MGNYDLIVTTLKLFQPAVIFMFCIEAVHILQLAIKTVRIFLKCRLSCAFVWCLRHM